MTAHRRVGTTYNQYTRQTRLNLLKSDPIFDADDLLLHRNSVL